MNNTRNTYSNSRRYSNDNREISAERSELRIANNRRRRQRIFRRQVSAIVLLVSIIIIIGCFITFSYHASAQTKDYVPEFKYYKSVTVHTGDSLWDIAGEFYSEQHYNNYTAYLSEICQINKIANTSTLKAGESLIIPYYSTEFK